MNCKGTEDVTQRKNTLRILTEVLEKKKKKTWNFSGKLICVLEIPAEYCIFGLPEGMQNNGEEEI